MRSTVPAFLLLCLFAPVCLADDDRASGPEEAASSPSSHSGFRGRLPRWLHLGVELRGRAEFNRDPGQGVGEALYLNRLRLDVTVEPAPWVRFVFRGQDAHAFDWTRRAAVEPFQNSFETTLGYVEFGHPEGRWNIRAGRQEIPLGDERLAGADSEWDAFGLSFDAVHATFGGERLRAEAFTGYRVHPLPSRFDRIDFADHLSGLSLQWNAGGARMLVEPYLLWKHGRDSVNLLCHTGHRDIVTPGVRLVGALPANFDYNVELTAERGHVIGDHVSAWAGHWEAGWKPLGRDAGPRLALEYNFASGDADPADGRHQTFDDLYPAGFNQYGITDPFAWRNIRFVGAGFELPFSRRLNLAAGYRSYWLANRADGLYPGGDDYAFRHPHTSSTHIGQQVFVAASLDLSSHWRATTGFGHLHSGGFLQTSGHSSAMRTLYLATTVVF